MTKSLRESLITGVVVVLLGTILAFGISIERRLDVIEKDVAVIKSKVVLKTVTAR